jgi:dTDP-4-dehydrorhamnose 3,5-epimerase
VRIKPTSLPDVLLIELEAFEDRRGVFVRQWDSERWAAEGVGPFVQDNVSVSEVGVLRGLHFQSKAPQGKLLQVLQGKIFDVAVDIRPDSPTCGQWVGVTLQAGEYRQIWIPPGFAHGFAVLEGPATVHYRCTTPYDPDDQHGIRWNDPKLRIEWPINDPVLSDRDARFSDWNG